jgi:transaldolase/glucose-6-phosphate isomerase
LKRKYKKGTKMNTLIKLLDYGQSYWLDNLTRKKITGGELKKRVNEQGLRGITSNPSIFNKAISESEDYRDQIRSLVEEGKSLHEIYEALTVKDVQDACDILKPVFDESDGVDGFVSLEVSPYLARNTQGTMGEVRRLFKAVDRANCFIKIPGTPEGLPAIEQMLYEGVNVNITLLFSIDRYAAVARAYIKALQRRAEEGKDISKIRSVASFFLSRIDVLTDQLLGHKIIPAQSREDQPGPEALLGEAGIASARLAYQRFKDIFSGEEWEQLQQKGAKVQRPLWASTSTKDPLYSDVRYVEALIAPNTVNTLPDRTISAFADHGILQENTIEENIGQAKKVFDDLDKLDIDIDFITQQLENEGIQKFIDPYDELMSTLAKERAKVLGDRYAGQEISYGNLKSEIVSSFDSLDEKQTGRRLFDKDPMLWAKNKEEAEEIRNSMGWLTLPQDFGEKVEGLTTFAGQVKGEGYQFAVLLGMGDSSLGAEMARETYDTNSGYLELLVLDDTASGAIENIEKQIELEKTLFLVASKSGTSTETISLYKYFYDQVEQNGIKNAGKHFVAITDEGTPLAEKAKDKGFRKVFINPSDVGGCNSVLSYFGLVPMALMGLDIKKLLHSADQMRISCGPFVPAETNPGLQLGAALGICARNGRDKVTFALSPSIKAFGWWLTELFAESTGEEGKGLIPVVGEPFGPPEEYSGDRVFVHLFVPNDGHEETNRKLKGLENAGHPVVRISVPDKLHLGGEYYRWEIAAAIAGMVIGEYAFHPPVLVH